MRVVSGSSPACGSTHACQKSKHKHTLCTLYQAQAQLLPTGKIRSRQPRPALQHARACSAADAHAVVSLCFTKTSAVAVDVCNTFTTSLSQPYACAHGTRLRTSPKSHPVPRFAHNSSLVRSLVNWCAQLLLPVKVTSSSHNAVMERPGSQRWPVKRCCRQMECTVNEGCRFPEQCSLRASKPRNDSRARKSPFYVEFSSSG